MIKSHWSSSANTPSVLRKPLSGVSLGNRYASGGGTESTVSKNFLARITRSCADQSATLATTCCICSVLIEAIVKRSRNVKSNAQSTPSVRGRGFRCERFPNHPVRVVESWHSKRESRQQQNCPEITATGSAEGGLKCDASDAVKTCSPIVPKRSSGASVSVGQTRFRVPQAGCRYGQAFEQEQRVANSRITFRRDSVAY